MVGLKDVAKLANVSVMTVSRVINGNVNVADQTKNRVESAIRELGYVPNRIAKALVNSCTKTIGVLFSNIFNPVYMSILSSIEKRARELGYQIVICNASDYNSAVTDIKLLMSKMIDGIIILPVEFDAMNDSCTEKEGVDDMWKFYEKLRSMIAQYNFPCVVIDIDIGIESVDYVCHDYAEAARIGIEYLIGEGFKRIHFVNSELNDGLWAERQQIYRQVMKDRGLEHEIRIDYCENKSSSAFKLAKKIMTTGERPEAFYCANDVLAIGVMQAISDCAENPERYFCNGE